jgi:hypothetical protein
MEAGWGRMKESFARGGSWDDRGVIDPKCFRNNLTWKTL